jgi:hypothetical protein
LRLPDARRPRNENVPQQNPGVAQSPRIEGRGKESLPNDRKVSALLSVAGAPWKTVAVAHPCIAWRNQPDSIRAVLDILGFGFRCQYDVLPQNIMPRFIVQTSFLTNRSHNAAGALAWSSILTVAKPSSAPMTVDGEWTFM